MERSKVWEAAQKHKDGYNCCQAVVCTYCERLGMDEKTAFRAAEAYGLGIAGMFQTCGSVCGMMMLAGLKNSDANLAQPASKFATFDLGKEMVRLAAKRGDATYFVANMKDIPVADGAFDMVTELFAPFNEREFARVLAPEGSLYTVVPGARHLFGLKEVLYDTPYLNDEKLPKTTELELVGTQRVSANITLQTQADIEAVFQMTPYYYRTRPADKERLANLDTLQTDIDFIIAEYRHC